MSSKATGAAVPGKTSKPAVAAAPVSAPRSDKPQAPKAAATKSPAVPATAVESAVATDEVQAKSLVLEHHQVVLRPLVTEKGMHRATRNNAYSFEVHATATKTDVKAAVEALYDVKVEKVNIQNRQGKRRRTRMRVGFTKPWKKAIVFVSDEKKLDIY